MKEGTVQKVLDFLQEASKNIFNSSNSPLGIGMIAFNTKLSESTVQRICQQLYDSGKIEMMEFEVKGMSKRFYRFPKRAGGGTGRRARLRT